MKTLSFMAATAAIPVCVGSSSQGRSEHDGSHEYMVSLSGDYQWLNHIVIFIWPIKRTLWWTKPQSFYSMNVGLPIYSTNLLTFQGSRNALLACSRECACLVQVQTQTRNWEQLGHPFHHSIPEYTRANKTQALSCRLNPIPHGGRRDIWHQLLSLKPTLICIYGTWD